jgi:hypothetical protein
MCLIKNHLFEEIEPRSKQTFGGKDYCSILMHRVFVNVLLIGPSFFSFTLNRKCSYESSPSNMRIILAAINLTTFQHFLSPHLENFSEFGHLNIRNIWKNTFRSYKKQNTWLSYEFCFVNFLR